MNRPETILIHHSAVSRRKARYQFYQINRYHRWKYNMRSSFGFYVGYHWLIEPNGRKIHCRADENEGAHTLGGWNRKSIGVCLAGNFAQEAPTQAQLKSVRELINKYNLPYIFHKEADPTRTCAGIYLTHELIDKGGTQDKEDYEKAQMISRRFNLPFAYIINLIKQLK